jgi:hypothetical protein
VGQNKPPKWAKPSCRNHEDLSIFILCGYVVMLCLSVLTMKPYGLAGFIVTWLVWEIIQTRFVVGLNERLFPKEHRITTAPLLRLSIFMTVAFALALYPAYQ